MENMIMFIESKIVFLVVIMCGFDIYIIFIIVK